MASYPTSTCATDGSATGSCQSKGPLSSSSNMGMDDHGFHSPSSSSSTTANHNHLSAKRITGFLANPINSQILHRHSSTEARMKAHEGSMKAYLESFDVAYKG